MRIECSFPLDRVPSDERVIERSWRKLAAFILAEGPAETVRKVRSKQASSALSTDYHLVVAIGREFTGEDEQTSDEASSLCLGTRHPACASVMLFHENLIVPLARTPTPDNLAATVREAITTHGIDTKRLGGYNFHSDLPPPPGTLDFVRELASLLNDERRAPSTASYPALEGEAGVLVPPAHRRVPRSNPSASGLKDQRRTSEDTRRGVAVIAAGDYVRTQVIPALRKAGFALRVVADLEPHVAAYAQSHFGFETAETDWRAALEHPGTDVAVIATYHDSHAEIAAAALNQGKKVILEKPPAVTRSDLDLLLLAAAEPGAFLEIGYNRRYAPFARAAKRSWIEGNGPTTISIVVKEVEIPPTHWYRWPKEGTRVTGNLCHWIDFVVFMIGAERTPIELTLSAPAAPEPDEERTLTIVFDDGSVASIVATQRGDATLGVQESIDIRRGPVSIYIDDFRRFHATEGGRVLDRRRSLRNKGHSAMYVEMLGRIMGNKPARYTLAELRRTTELTLTATEMVVLGDRHVALR